ncbi:MAG: radical SAM protein [Marinilabiliales bacterium]|nr:MAG: radical SAM protein [Marinilabiliales bacterium]
MLDKFNRKITYLRVSVTDRCNLRCEYCMPAEGIKLIAHKDILSFDEIVNVCRTAAYHGVNKIRITGGEPLVRKGIVDLVRSISAIEGVDDIGMTTNGILLPKFANELKNAGLMRVNISLDTLDPDEYRKITRGGEITSVIQGIVAAQKVGLEPIKINSVVFDNHDNSMKDALKKFAKDMNLQIRFITQMHLDTGEFSIVEGGTGGDCSICNSIRLTANGFIKPCLFSDDQYSVRELGA